MKQIRILLLLLALCFTAGLARAQSPVQLGVTPIGTSSGNVAATTASAALIVAANKTGYVCGFMVTGTGATAASVIDVTLGTLAAGTFHWEVAIPAGVTTSITPLVVNFNPCLPGQFGSNFGVTAPSFGAGNTNAAVDVWGFQQ